MLRLSTEATRVGEITALSLIMGASTAVSLVLTCAPCYATLCSEDYFAFETRLHLVIYYGFLFLLGFFLILRQYVSAIRSLSGHHVLGALPVVGKRITIGGLLFSILVLALVGAPTAFWLPAQDKFWGLRADPLDWASAKLQLTITGVSGHYADILLGLLVIPVSRNSLIGHAFSLHQSTLLFAHKMLSYLFTLGALTHGVVYMLFYTDNSSEGNAAREEAFDTGNPTLTVSESEKRGSWFTLTMYTGIAALVLVLLIVMTSVPYVRRHHYNLFYYSHVTLAVIVFIASCVHANTNFYLLIPGLLLWIVDLFRRFFRGETGGLSRKVIATVENAGNAWIRISLPTSKKAEAHAEKSLPSTQPLSSYYLTIPSISKLQNHAFAAAIPSSSTSGPVFLLQRAKGKTQEALDKEWTWKLGNMVPRPMDNHSLEVKVEGPYPVNDAGFRTASHIVCIVGGTGITGASSLARWWLETVSVANRFTLIWTVRRREMAMVREWQELEEMARPQHNMSVSIHVSSEDGRLDALRALQRALGRDRRSNRPAGGSAWVYSSGPDSLLGATERACVEMKRDLRASRDGRGPGAWTVEDMSWYMARWEV